MGSRVTTAVAIAAALALIADASGSNKTLDGAIGDLTSRLQNAQAPTAAVSRPEARELRLRPRVLAQMSQHGRSRVRFGVASRTVGPLGAAFSNARCGRTAPNAVSGFFLVDSQATGEVHPGDFFPSLNPAGNRARSWLVGLRSGISEPRGWLGGVVCTRASVRYRVFSSAARPLQSDGGIISCPRNAPNAISGFYLVGSETTGELLLGDFFPELRGRGRKTRARGWVVGVKNLTDKRQGWLGGVVCTSATVRFSLGREDVAPLATTVRAATCPRATPKVVSGLSLVVTDTPGDTYQTGEVQVGDFFPLLRRPPATTRTWVVGVKNLTNLPQEWIWGAMCMR